MRKDGNVGDRKKKRVQRKDAEATSRTKRRCSDGPHEGTHPAPRPTTQRLGLRAENVSGLFRCKSPKPCLLVIGAHALSLVFRHLTELAPYAQPIGDRQGKTMPEGRRPLPFAAMAGGWLPSEC